MSSRPTKIAFCCLAEFWKRMAVEVGVPYQSRINLYLRDCLAQQRNVKID